MAKKNQKVVDYQGMSREELIDLLKKSRQGSSSSLEVINKIKSLKGTEQTLEVDGIKVIVVQSGFMLDKRSASFLVEFEVKGFKDIKFRRDVSTIKDLDLVFEEAHETKSKIRKYMQENNVKFEEAVDALGIK